MDIKNREISLSLNENEEVFYVAEKNKSSYIFNTIGIIIMGLNVGIGSIFALVYFHFNPLYLLLLSLIFIYCFYIIFDFTRNYFFRDVILTNQRIIFLTPKTQTSTTFEQIFYAKVIKGNICNILKVKLKSGEKYSLSFIKGDIFKDKLIRVYRQYQDPEMSNSEKVLIAIAVIIAIAVFIFIKTH